MRCTGCLLPCPIQCGHGCKHGDSGAVSLSACDFKKGKKSTSTFGLKNAPGSTPSWTRDVRCRVHEHRFMQLPVMRSPGPRTRLPSMAWIFYRCRHTGLGIVIGPNTRQYVRHSLMCALQSLSDVILSRFNSRPSTHCACCRHNHTSIAKVRTT